MPDEVVFDHLHATAFQHSPLGRTILGPAENVRAITRQNLADYIASNYTAPRIVVAAAGAVDHDSLVKSAEKVFAKLPTAGPSAGELVRANPSFFTGSDVRIRDPDHPTVNLAVAYKGAASADPDSVPLMVTQTLLGAWNKNSGVGVDGANTLAQRVAVNGLADSYMAFNTNYHDTGGWAGWGGVPGVEVALWVGGTARHGVEVCPAQATWWPLPALRPPPPHFSPPTLSSCVLLSPPPRPTCRPVWRVRRGGPPLRPGGPLLVHHARHHLPGLQRQRGGCGPRPQPAEDLAAVRPGRHHRWVAAGWLWRRNLRSLSGCMFSRQRAGAVWRRRFWRGWNRSVGSAE